MLCSCVLTGVMLSKENVPCRSPDATVSAGSTPTPHVIDRTPPIKCAGIENITDSHFVSTERGREKKTSTTGKPHACLRCSCLRNCVRNRGRVNCQASREPKATSFCADQHVNDNRLEPVRYLGMMIGEMDVRCLQCRFDGEE